MKTIYGTIGYTILENPNTKKKNIILADMHDSLPSCTDKINISDWFKSKFNSSQILLEEVPRENFVLHELWTQSEHTQALKNLFLKNTKIIKAVDIRPFLIPFSWELINDNKEEYQKFILNEYLLKIDSFFCMKEPYLLENLLNYKIDKLENTKLGNHYLIIKTNYYKLLNKCKDYLKEPITKLYLENINLLEKINDLLNEIMEWYICACIELYNHRTIIIHIGLAHSEKVIDWLINHYNNKVIKKQGINTLDETINSPLNGCIHLPLDLEQQFGGFTNNL